MKKARERSLSVKAGNVISSDCFYGDNPDASLAWKKMGVLAVEMEAAALYMNAARAGKKALTVLTVSDLIFGTEEMSAKEREQGFGTMISLALDAAIETENK
jgi:purine-nucleoside phosphorylase